MTEFASASLIAEGRAMNPLRAGVLGVGVFGALHARKYAALAGVELAGVFDPHPERARRLASDLGVQACEDVGALLAAAHVVTVASPAHTHAALAERALAAQVHAYVEKPLAASLAEGSRLVRHARDRRLVLACGHQERVVFAAMGLLDAPEIPLRIESVRRGTPNARNRDVSCVLDLMIHDLDLALAVCGEAVLSVQAEGQFDAVRADATFASGTRTVFEASRIAERRERTMRVVYPSGEVFVDFLAPSFRNTAAFTLNEAFAATPDGRDPLGASVGAFLAAVRGQATRPAVTGEEGLRALELALAVERAAGL